MERPVLFYFLLPFTIISLVLYARILVITWRKSSSLTFNTFFYKQMRSQVSFFLFSIWKISFRRFSTFPSWLCIYWQNLQRFWHFIYWKLIHISGVAPSLAFTHGLERDTISSTHVLPHVLVHTRAGLCLRRCFRSDVTAQAYGITLIALNRMLLVCYPTSRFSMVFRSILRIRMRLILANGHVKVS